MRIKGHKTQKFLAAGGTYDESSASAKALAASELRYRRLFESAKDGILILDAETGMVEDVNPFLTNLLGFSRAEFLDKRVWELGFFRNLAANAEKFAELQAREYVRYEDLPLETEDGRVREVEFVSNVYLAGGKRVIQCNIRDITERKRVEAYRDLKQDILQVLNEPGETNDFLPRVLALLKTSADFDAVGIRLQDGEDFPFFVQDGFPEDFLKIENTLIEHGKHGEVCRDAEGNICLECTCGLVLTGQTDPSNPLFTRGGSAWTNDSSFLLHIPSGDEPRHQPRNPYVHQGYASVALVPIRDKDRIVGLLQFNGRQKGDLTLEIIEILEEIASHIGSALIRTRAEQALMMKSMLLEAQKEASPDGILAVDNEGHALLFNTRFGEIWNIPREVLDSHNEQAMLELISKQLQDPEIFHRTVARLYKHKEKTSRDEVHLLDGRCFDRYSSPLTDAEGKNQGRIWYFREITDRKREEATKAALADELRHAQKLEAVGQLAGGVAHDFNNMLMVILGSAELCRGKVAPDQPMREWLDQITSAAERSAEITRQLLAFARKQVIAPQVLDLNDAVSSMLKLLRRLIGEDIDLIWQPDENAWPTMIDPAQVDQILANLLVNARDSISGTGRITLSTENVTIGPDYSLRHVVVAPGDYVMLAVSDTGRGMDEATQARVFEPFFTTKGVGEGSGLGLSTVHGIVQQNNGSIHVYSEPGRGTAFRIYLPRANAGSDAEPGANIRVHAPQGHGETILLVEDEESVRTMCKRFLDDSGYTVISAVSPEQALDIGSHTETHIDLLITDVIMPGMDGRELARRLDETHPAMQVLFMSGYPSEIIAPRGQLTQDTAFLSKPFSRHEIMRKVHAVLNHERMKWRHPPIRSHEQSSSTGTEGAIWLTVLMGVLTVIAVAGVVYLSVRISGGADALAEGRRTLTAEEPALVEGRTELASGRQELSEGRQAYATAKQRWYLVWADRLFRGGRGFREAKEQIAEGERSVVAGEDKLSDGQAQFDVGRLMLRRGSKQLEQARHLRWALTFAAIFFGAASLVLGVHRAKAVDHTDHPVG